MYLPYEQTISHTEGYRYLSTALMRATSSSWLIRRLQVQVSCVTFSQSLLASLSSVPALVVITGTQGLIKRHLYLTLEVSLACLVCWTSISKIDGSIPATTLRVLPFPHPGCGGKNWPYQWWPWLFPTKLHNGLMVWNITFSHNEGWMESRGNKCDILTPKEAEASALLLSWISVKKECCTKMNLGYILF